MAVAANILRGARRAVQALGHGLDRFQPHANGGDYYATCRYCGLAAVIISPGADHDESKDGEIRYAYRYKSTNVTPYVVGGRIMNGPCKASTRMTQRQQEKA